jgi:hypothetical protein
MLYSITKFQNQSFQLQYLSKSVTLKLKNFIVFVINGDKTKIQFVC